MTQTLLKVEKGNNSMRVFPKICGVISRRNPEAGGEKPQNSARPAVHPGWSHVESLSPDVEGGTGVENNGNNTEWHLIWAGPVLDARVHCSAV